MLKIDRFRLAAAGKYTKGRTAKLAEFDGSAFVAGEYNYSTAPALARRALSAPPDASDH